MKRHATALISSVLSLAALVPILAAVMASPPAAFAGEAGTAEGVVRTTSSADGIPIAYEIRGEGSPTIVFIHGWSCDRGYWREQIGAFAPEHRVVAVDLAGHGASGAGRQDCTMAAFGADVAAVLAAEDIDDAILVGHSMGGPVAVEAALAAPDRVRGIVGVDNFQAFAQEVPQEQVDAFVGALTANFVPVVGSWVRMMFPAGADSELVARVAADMAAGDPQVGLSAIRHTLRWMGGGGADRVRQLRVNITTISSDMQETAVAANRQLVPGFEARIIPGTGHFLMLERPEEFNRLLAAAVAEF